MTQPSSQSPEHPRTTAAGVEAVRAAVREALAAGQGIYPRGGQTQWLEGMLPPSASASGREVDLTGCCAVIDYPARDMTITVQAGIRIADLQATLAREGQWLPIDVPQAHEATLGGCLAMNTHGPRRQGYGTLRDYLIGIEFINDAEERIKAGGRVVKNVAGYDLCKLLIGSRGTLGVITQATLKVRPVPAAAGRLLYRFGRDQLAPILNLLDQTASQPASVDLESQTGDDASQLGVLFEGAKAAVEWQMRQFQREAGFLANQLIEDEIGSLGVSQERVDHVLQRLTAPAACRWQLRVLPSQLADAWPAAQAISDQTLMFPGCGWISGSSARTVDAAAVQNLRQLVEAMGGQLTVLAGPDDWRTPAMLWGTPRDDWALMRLIKQHFDPGNRFSPGRFFVDQPT